MQRLLIGFANRARDEMRAVYIKSIGRKMTL